MQLAEPLEPRCLLAVTPILINDTELLVQLEASDSVTSVAVDERDAPLFVGWDSIPTLPASPTIGSGQSLNLRTAPH